jgi:alpha,alpha-trehalase
MRLLLIFLLIPVLSFAREFKRIEVNPGQELQRLLRSLDKNLDDKITPADKPDKFQLKDSKGKTHEIHGDYHLSNLLQELKLLSEEKKKILDGDYIFENPVTRNQRFIKNYFWKNLRRHLDFSEKGRLFFSSQDPDALLAYNVDQKENFKVLSKNEKFKDLWGMEEGYLCLGVKQKKKVFSPVTYLSSGRNLQALRGMDSYFAVLGLLADDELELAFDLVKAVLYEIENYGKVLSENRSDHLLTSHPPFVSSMVRAVFNHLPKTKATRAWLQKAVELVAQDYEEFWRGKDRLTLSGLSRYGGILLNAKDYPEFDDLLQSIAKSRDESVTKVQSAFIKSPQAFPEIMDFLKEWGCMQESGHMGTHRFKVEGKDKCTDIAPVALNAALFKTELDLAYLVKFGLRDKFEKESEHFLKRAKKRKLLIRTFLWDEKKSLFFDYNIELKRRSDYLSATTFYPLWAYDPNQPDLALLTKEEALKLSKEALTFLEAEGGVFASSESSMKFHGAVGKNRLWDYPYGLAPHQMILWQGLKNYNQDENLQRLVYKWLFLLTKTAMEEGGAFPKVFNLKESNLSLAQPLSNTGLDFRFVPRHGFIWTNASYQYGLSLLSPALRPMLEKLVPYKELKD